MAITHVTRQIWNSRLVMYECKTKSIFLQISLLYIFYDTLWPIIFPANS